MALGLLKSNASPIAVDFGVASLKVLQLSLGDAPSLVAAAAIETPEELIERDAERLAWQADQLPGLMQGLGFKGKKAVCSVSANRTMVQHVQVPRLEGVSVLEAAKEQLRAMTGLEPGSLIVRHVEVGEVTRAGNKCVEVIMIAMPRDVVLAHVKALKSARLECVGVHSEHMATVKAFDSITRRMADSDLTSLYVDLGYGTTKVIMSNGKDLVFAKTIAIGGRTFDAAIAKEMDCTPALARKKRCAESASLAWTVDSVRSKSDTVRLTAPQERVLGGKPGIGAAIGAEADPTVIATLEPRRPDEAGSPAQSGASFVGPEAGRSRLVETVEALTDEISMCLRYAQAIFPNRLVGRSIFVGGEARQTEVCRAIAKSLRLPAQVADPMLPLRTGNVGKTKGFERDKAQPGWTVPIGLCLMPIES